MKISDFQPNRKVIYTPFKGCDPKFCEEGVTVSVNSSGDSIFVRYGNDVNAKWTDPCDLEYQIK